MQIGFRVFFDCPKLSSLIIDICFNAGTNATFDFSSSKRTFEVERQELDWYETSLESQTKLKISMGK